MLQLSPVLSQMPAENLDIKPSKKPSDIESDDDSGTGSMQFFVNSAAANTPLVGPLLASAAEQHGRLTAAGGLEMAGVASSGSTSTCDDVIDFTGLVSPSKVSSAVLLLLS